MNLRKKILALLLAGVMLVAAGCGSNQQSATSASAESESAAAQTLDLSGSWVAEVQGSDYYLAGFIKGDLIELHWVSSYDQNGSVYWAGTYPAPKDNAATYTWESTRDDAIMATSAYASVDQTRTFSYSEGKLTLEASSTGVETVLIPSDTDYTYLAVDMSEAEDGDAEAAQDQQEAVDNSQAAAAEETQDIALADSGYAIEAMGSGTSLIYYAVEIENPNEYNTILSPNIEITVLDANGRVLTKQHRALFAVAPGNTLCYGDAISCPKGRPDSVEIAVKNNDYDFTAFPGDGVHAMKDFEVSDVSEDHSGNKTQFSGTITNTSGEDANGVIASVVFKKDGKIVGGATGEIGSIAAGESISFNIAAKSGFSDYDSYDVYVTQEEV